MPRYRYYSPPCTRQLYVYSTLCRMLSMALTEHDLLKGYNTKSWISKIQSSIRNLIIYFELSQPQELQKTVTLRGAQDANLIQPVKFHPHTPRNQTRRPSPTQARCVYHTRGPTSTRCPHQCPHSMGELFGSQCDNRKCLRNLGTVPFKISVPSGVDFCTKLTNGVGPSDSRFLETFGHHRWGSCRVNLG